MTVMSEPALAQATAEAKAYLRVHGTEEDALIGRLVASGAALCEAFTGRWLLAREGQETIAPGPAWVRIKAGPVRAILGAAALANDGTATPLPPGEFEIDIDANGQGWARIPGGAHRRVQVRFEAGMAADWAELPEPLRQGVIRIAAHLYTHRSSEAGAGPPAAVTAMWRPWRRVGLGTRTERVNV